MPSGERYYHLDFLRIISAFAVIVIHVSAANWYSTDVNSFAWNMFNVYDVLVRFSIPVFVMISGALFLQREIDLGRLYKNNILRLVKVYILWSVLYTGILVAQGKCPASDFLLQTARGYYHMWFLLMLIGLYAITPFLRTIAKSRNLTEYFLLLFLIFGLLRPFVVGIAELCSQQAGVYAGALYKNFNLLFVSGYSGVFLLGYYLTRKPLSDKAARWLYALAVLCLVFNMGFTAVASRIRQAPVDLLYNHLSLNNVIVGAAVFVFAQRNLRPDRLSDRQKRLLVRLSDLSFGVYLIHPMVIDFLNDYCQLNPMSFNAALSIPVISVLVCLISCALSWVLTRIPLLRKLAL